MTKESHALHFHMGETLFAIAKTYNTLELCLVEAVQNAVDADATCVYVGVDLIERRAAICDNGNGATVAKFRQALGSIGKGIKSKDALGKFGRGLVASIHLTQLTQFLSKPRGSQKVHEWTFVGGSLRQQAEEISIPYTSLEAFPELPPPFNNSLAEARPPKQRGRIVWRTMMLLDNITQDQQLSAVSVEHLGHIIRTKLGGGMRKKGTTVYLKVRDEKGEVKTYSVDPTAYDGEPLPGVTFDTEGAGAVELELYRARLRGGQRKGQVVVMQTSDNYPITIQELRTQALGARWYRKDSEITEFKDGIDALSSGYFEGVIRAEKIELAPERTKFELSDALTDLFWMIASWFEKTGSQLVHDAREEQTEKRYRELGGKSLDRLYEQLRTNSALAPLAHGLKDVLPAARTSGKQGPVKPKPEDRRPKRPTGRRVVVPPKQVPEGDKRSPVSAFISFAYELLQGSPRLWEYDVDTGVLTFNIRHFLWGKVDPEGKRTPKSDLRVMLLQEWLALKLLLLLTDHPAEEIELHRSIIDKEIEPYVEVVILR